MPCEEECRSRERLIRSLESLKEKFDSIRTVEEDDIQVIMGVIEGIDILIEDHISLFFGESMKMLCQGVNTMNAEAFFVDKNLLRVAWFCEEMHLHLVFEPGTSVGKLCIFFVMIADNGEMPESLETMKEFFCDFNEVLK